MECYVNTKIGMGEIEKREYTLIPTDNNQFIIKKDDKVIKLKKIPFLKFMFKEYTIFTIGFAVIILSILILHPAAAILGIALSFATFHYLLKKQITDTINKIIAFVTVTNASISFILLFFIKRNIYKIADINSLLLYSTILYALTLYMLYFKHKYINILVIADEEEKPTRWYLFYKSKKIQNIKDLFKKNTRK